MKNLKNFVARETIPSTISKLTAPRVINAYPRRRAKQRRRRDVRRYADYTSGGGRMPASGRGAIKRQQLRATKRRKIERARDGHRPSLGSREEGRAGGSSFPAGHAGHIFIPAHGPNWPECSVRQLSIRLIINYIDAAAFELIPPLFPQRRRGARVSRQRADVLRSCRPLDLHTLFATPFLKEESIPRGADVLS